MLDIRDMESGYGPVRVLNGISFSVGDGELVALIGPNGAGKSTTLRSIMGLCRMSAGEAYFAHQRIDHLGPEETARRGIALVPEGRRLFPGLSVRENLMVALVARRGPRPISADSGMDEVMGVFPGLERRINSPAWTLSGGEQQMVAIGRAMMARPDLMLLDEPSMGLAPQLITEMFNALQRINAAGTSILLVEQNAYQALQISDRALVLTNGEIVQSGPADVLRDSPEIAAAYFGH